MVTLPRKELYAKLIVLRSMKDHRDLACLTTLEDNGLVLSSVVKSVGACSWCIAGTKTSAKIEHYTIELSRFIEACSAAKPDTIDIDFVENGENTSLVVTAGDLVVNLAAMKPDESPVDSEQLDAIVETLRTELENPVQIDAKALCDMCGFAIKKRRVSTESDETKRNIRYTSTYFTLNHTSLVACRYSRKNAIHVIRNVDVGDDNPNMSFVISNEVVDGVTKQFLLNCEDTNISLILKHDGNVLDVIVGNGILSVPVNEKLGVTQEEIGAFDVLTPAIAEMQTGNKMESVGEVEVGAVELSDHLETASRFGTDGRVDIKVTTDNKISVSARGRGVHALTEISVVTEGITDENVELDDQDPHNIREVLKTIGALKPETDDDVPVKLELVKPKTGLEAEREKMIIITSEGIKAVSIWEG